MYVLGVGVAGGMALREKSRAGSEQTRQQQAIPVRS
jgi:hypothetical protein